MYTYHNKHMYYKHTQPYNYIHPYFSPNTNISELHASRPSVYIKRNKEQNLKKIAFHGSERRTNHSNLLQRPLLKVCLKRHSGKHPRITANDNTLVTTGLPERPAPLSLPSAGTGSGTPSSFRVKINGSEGATQITSQLVRPPGVAGAAPSSHPPRLKSGRPLRTPPPTCALRRRTWGGDTRTRTAADETGSLPAGSTLARRGPEAACSVHTLASAPPRRAGRPEDR